MGLLEDIPVPASPPGSHIAWSWLRENCPRWHSDAADEDTFPAGRPGVDGDGFSVYEEYRGFYLYRPRTHHSTEPAKKDLFVLNNAGFQAGVGIGQFFKVSKLHGWRLQLGDLPGDRYHDWGLYTQLLWGFTPGWAAGLRYEYATGSGPSVSDGGRQADFLRDDRHRVSPLIIWQPSEFSRIRLQYDFDHADFLPSGDAHSLWLAFEVLYGAHPAHQY